MQIVVASTATQWFGHEGDILRYVFFHSVALAALVGILTRPGRPTYRRSRCSSSDTDRGPRGALPPGGPEESNR